MISFNKGNFFFKVWICAFSVAMLVNGTLASTTNLTCYQCEKHNDEECDIKDLKPCASSFDRCAIQFTKNAQQGMFIKRTCGLGPCGFDDDMMAKGLGMDCDRSKDSYWCVICCKESGCNKNYSADTRVVSNFLLLFGLLMICLLNVARDFIPPYVSETRHFDK